jgi:uncharacterized repeat protein (TIGR02543 family)
VAVDMSGFVWVTNLSANTVSKIDTSTNTVTATINVGGSPYGVAVDRSGFVWVTNNGSNTVSKIDPSTNTVTATVGVGNLPFGVAADASGFVWVVNKNDSTVSKINASTNTVVATINVDINVGSNNNPRGIAVDASGFVWVADYSNNKVSKIDPSTNRLTATVGVGAMPFGMAVDASGFVWVTNNVDESVSKIDPSTNTVLVTINVDGYPDGIAADASGFVWVTSLGSNQVYKIDPSTNTVVATINVGATPISIGDFTGFAYQKFVLGYTMITAPTVTLSAATNETTTTATINGNVTNTGGDNPDVTMYWGTTDGGTTPSNWDHSSNLGTQGATAFEKNLLSLSPSTTYYFSAKATNSTGDSWPAASLSFATIATHTVTFGVTGSNGTLGTTVDGDAIDTGAQVADGKDVYFTAAPADGYQIKEWKINGSSLGESDKDNPLTVWGIDGDLNVTVEFEAIPPTTHTVHFDANGGTGSMNPQTASSSTTLTANAFARTGYTFNGWNTAADNSGTSYADGAAYDFSGDTTLYAQWTTTTGPTHTVHFDANGGSGSMSDQTADAPTDLTTNTFTRTNYTFNGWNDAADGSGTSYVDSATYDFNGDTTLFAQWTSSPSNIPGGNNNSNSDQPQQAKIDSWSAYQSTDINKINCPQRLKLVINGKHFDKDAKIRISEREASSVDVNSSHKIVAKFCLAKLLAHQADRQRTISVQNPDTSREKADKQIDLDSFRKASTPESSNIESNSSNDTSSNNLSASSSSAPLSTEKQNSPGNPIQKTSSQQSNNNDTGNLTPNACSYAIQSGDTLWSIAKKIYGDATAYQEIIDNNKDQYPNIASKLSIGQQLTFGCDNNSNKNIANSNQNSASQAQPQPQQPKHHFSWWNPLTWF